MSLSHYCETLPHWGSHHIRFDNPPSPSFQPRDHWSGLHYFMAHAINPDPELYDHAIERASSSTGLGIVEARHWHRLVYGGLAELIRRSPAEIGHASAYEAFRNVLHHIPVQEMMSEDHDRQKEILVSLAIAEATHLWPETGRHDDHHGLLIAVAAAAATAALIFSQHRDIKDLGTDHHQSRSRAMYADTYNYDDEALRGRRRQGSGPPSMGPGGMGHYSPHGRMPSPSPSTHIRASSASPSDVYPWGQGTRGQYDTTYGKSPSAISPVGGYPSESGLPSGNPIAAHPNPYGPSNTIFSGLPGMGAGAYGALPSGVYGGAYGGASNYGAMPTYSSGPNSAGGAYGHLPSGQVGVRSQLPGPTIIVRMPRHKHRSSRHRHGHGHRYRAAGPDGYDSY